MCVNQHNTNNYEHYFFLNKKSKYKPQSRNILVPKVKKPKPNLMPLYSLRYRFLIT